MAASSLQTSQIKRPIKEELELLERELEHILKSDLGLVQGIGEHLLAIKGKRVRPILLFLSSHMGRPDPGRSAR